MIWVVAFYWICAGMASYSADRLLFGSGLFQFGCSMLLGGFMIPARIFAKLAA